MSTKSYFKCGNKKKVIKKLKKCMCIKISIYIKEQNKYKIDRQIDR